MFESERDRLGFIKGPGGETFSTGRAEKLWAIFERPHEDVLVGEMVFAARRPVLFCRTSDVSLHELKKQARVTRDSDGKSYFVKEIEDDGNGVTVLALT